MADLLETTLAGPVGASDTHLPLTSVVGINKGDGIYVDGEWVIVTGAPLGRAVPVMRGMAGSPGCAHAAGVPVFIGAQTRFHTTDPAGKPAAAPDDNPWINTRGRRVWRAVGDATGPGAADRLWVLVTSTTTIGALGIRTAPVATP